MNQNYWNQQRTPSGQQQWQAKPAENFSLNQDNMIYITAITKLVQLYDFTIVDTKISGTSSSMIFTIDANGIHNVITISKSNIYRFDCQGEISNVYYEHSDFKQIEKTMASVFDTLLEYNTYAKIKFDFREKLGASYAGNLFNTNSYDTIGLNIDGIIVTCKARIIDVEKSRQTTRHRDSEIMFDVSVKLGANNLMEMPMSGTSIIKFLQYYQTSYGLQFLIKFLKMFNKFNPEISNYSLDQSNTVFDISLKNLGNSKTYMNIYFRGIVTKFSNPLGHIYYIEYDDVPHYIVGSNLLKLVYLLCNLDLKEYYEVANIKEHIGGKEHREVRGKVHREVKKKEIKVEDKKKTRETKKQEKERKKGEKRKEKERKIREPKPARASKAPTRNRLPAFVKQAAEYVPTRNQPYPIPFTSLERTINTFGANHKNVLRRFNNNMTHEEFITFKNSFNNQVGFTQEQTQLIQMLPNDKDFVLAFFKVYDLV